MTPAAFSLQRPCLEEIEGYKDGVKWLELTYSSEEWTPLFHYERDLRAGKVMPSEQGRRQRSYQYRKGRKPQRK